MTVYEFIEKHEGRRKRVYQCPAGANTIGVGWNMDANELPQDISHFLAQNGYITDEMIDRMLKTSVRQAVADCRVLFPNFDGIDDARRMALTDFVFQLGFRRARQFSRAVAAVNTGRWEDAAKEMRDSAWFTQTPRRAEEITNIIETGEL
jgi:lysozyme